MLNTQTKGKINSLKDTLVGKIPTPEGQAEQITFALIYKFMSDIDKESSKLGGKSFFDGEYKKYAWENIIDSKTSGSERAELYREGLEKMNINANLPQLFRDIFKGAYLPFKDPEVITLFLRQIDEFNYDHSEDLGDAFEYLLSIVGAQGASGQFRTPRHIIDFIVEVVQPNKEDRILDPACGTAGFLIAAYKYIVKNNKLTDVDNTNLTKNVNGYDISPDMVRLSRVNMYLHRFPDPQIFEYDSLASEEKWKERFDTILANPPFMSPKGGIKPHSKFAIKANRSEVLFVDYIMEHLDTKGKAGVIVPEGIIFQSGGAYKDLRKTMIEDNYLWAVVSLPGGVFQPYSGVKTSILLFDKEIAKKSKDILFVKLENDGFDLGAQRRPKDGSQIDEVTKELLACKKEILEDLNGKGKTSEIKNLLNKSEDTISSSKDIFTIVKKSQINNETDYNLSGDRYKIDGLRENQKWPKVKLGDDSLFKIESGGTPDSTNKDYWDGSIHWSTLVDLPAGDIFTNINSTKRKISDLGLKNSSAKLLPINSILVSSRATIGRVAINRIELATNQGFKNIVIKDFDNVLPEYIAFMMSSLKEKMTSLASGGTFKEISKSNFETLEIPLPPLSIQQEIVEELDSYQKIIDGAKMVVENWKPVIEIDPTWNITSFGDKSVIEVIDGDRGKNYPKKEDFKKNGYCLFLNTSNVRKGYFDFSRSEFITKEKEEVLRKGKLKRNDLVMTTRGTLGNTAYYSDDIGYEDIRINSGMVILRVNLELISPLYLLHFLNSEQFIKEVENKLSGSAQPQLPITSLSKISIPLPNLDTQEKIVQAITKEGESINYTKKLIDIFEQKIKDRINGVWGE